MREDGKVIEVKLSKWRWIKRRIRN